MRLLHTGDLHLDSAFCAYGQRGAEQQREAGRDTLRRIFECAESEKCDMILIAGDLFDGKYVTPETETLFLSLCAASPFPIVIATGNHDPYTEGSFWKSVTLPEQVYLFNSSELQCFVFEELKVKVYGYAFSSAVMTESPLLGAQRNDENEDEDQSEDGYLHLLCAHADLSSPVSRYAPLTVGDIVGLGIDYAALGHIHNPPSNLSYGSTEIRYCGFAEGRSFDECGEGGVLLVTLAEGDVTVERRVVSETRYEQIELDVSAYAEESALRAAIGRVVSPYAERSGTHLRLTLVGTADPDMLSPILSDTSGFAQALASLQVQNLTIPCPDGASLERDITLRGALYRALYVRLIDSDPELRRTALRALQIGLAAIDGRRIPTEEDDV